MTNRTRPAAHIPAEAVAFISDDGSDDTRRAAGATATRSPDARATSMRVRVDAIDALLPQTQCTRCGYPTCRDYAQALAQDDTEPNRCPPGGQTGADALAHLLNKPAQPLDPECGSEGPRLIARIDPSQCIGCVKCILACPVDAIIGAPRRMHTVLPALCTGCELCVPPCPVDCIDIEPLPATIRWAPGDADAARARFDARKRRLRIDEQRTRNRLNTEALAKRRSIDAALANPEAKPAAFADDSSADLERKRRVVNAAIERARQRQAGRS